MVCKRSRNPAYPGAWTLSKPKEIYTLSDWAECFVQKQRWGLTLSACCHSYDTLGSPASPVLPWAAAWCGEASWKCGCSWPRDVQNLEFSGAAACRAVTGTAWPWVLISKGRVLEYWIMEGIVLISPAFFFLSFPSLLASLQKWRHQIVLSIRALSWLIIFMQWGPGSLPQTICFAPEEGGNMVNTLGQTWHKIITDWQEKEEINSS